MRFPTTLHADDDAGELPTTITLNVAPGIFVGIMDMLSVAERSKVYLSRAALTDLCFPRNLREVAKYCNETAIEIIKKLANAHAQPKNIINVVTYIGDDGNYKWISSEVVNKILAFLESVKEEKDGASNLSRISPQFITYIFLHGKRNANSDLKRKRALEPAPFKMKKWCSITGNWK